MRRSCSATMRYDMLPPYEDEGRLGRNEGEA